MRSAPSIVMRLLGTRLVLATVLLASACRAKTAADDAPAVCTLTLPKHLQHTQPDALPASVWYQLLFKKDRGDLSDDPVDCAGEPIRWSELPGSCGAEEPRARQVTGRAGEPLTQSDLVVRHAGGDYWFGWAPFLRFDDGESEGPLAIARVHHGKLEVRAIGNLRAYTRHARLAVRKVGVQRLLVAEGEHCDSRPTCSRGTRLMWLDRQRFRMRPLRAATVRDCLGPAWFPQTDVRETRLGTRWRRTLQRDVALSFEPDHIVIDEHITVNDRDDEQPSLPARLFREAQSQLRITVHAGELLSEGHSLWDTIRIEDGATRAMPDSQARP